MITMTELVISTAQAAECIMDTLTARQAIIQELIVRNEQMYARLLVSSFTWFIFGVGIGLVTMRYIYHHRTECKYEGCMNYNHFCISAECYLCRRNAHNTRDHFEERERHDTI